MQKNNQQEVCVIFVQVDDQKDDLFLDQVMLLQFDREDEIAMSSSLLCQYVFCHVDEGYALYTVRGACH